MLGCSVSWPMWLASTWSMLTPLWMMAPFWIGTLERRLPVIAGWMPWRVAFLLKRPWMTLTLAFSGSSGERVLPSTMSAPSPVADQWSGLTPQPMNRTAKRLGSVADATTGPASVVAADARL